MVAGYMKAIGGGAAVILAAGAAFSDGIDGRSAGKMLFGATGFEVVMVPNSGLSATDQAVLGQLFKLKAQDLKLLDQLPGISVADREAAKSVFARFKDASYYGAVAAAPADGLVGPATQIAQNLHSPQAANAAALAACQKLAHSACSVVAQILPKGFKARPLTLSQTATADFGSYRKAKGPKAMAASASTDAWAVATGIGASVGARRECDRLAASHGVKDCAVVVADD